MPWHMDRLEHWEMDLILKEHAAQQKAAKGRR